MGNADIIRPLLFLAILAGVALWEEITTSTVIKLTAVAALGAAELAVVIFEVLLNGTAVFNHGNIRLPLGAGRIMRLAVVTPDMHRVHHSVAIVETNSNFGFNLPCWDRLLGTYRTQPARGRTGMTIGLSHLREPKNLSLLRMLALPFTEGPGKYALGRSAREP